MPHLPLPLSRLCRRQVIVMTMPSVCADQTHCSSVFDWVELAAVIIFTIEYVMRIYAAPECYPVRMRPYPLLQGCVR